MAQIYLYRNSYLHTAAAAGWHREMPPVAKQARSSRRAWCLAAASGAALVLLLASSLRCFDREGECLSVRSVQA